jgi:hypothetical protein
VLTEAVTFGTSAAPRTQPLAALHPQFYGNLRFRGNANLVRKVNGRHRVASVASRNPFTKRTDPDSINEVNL